MRRSLLLAAAVLASSISGANAQQMQRVQVGVLECRGGASVGFIVGSVTNLGCVLRVDGVPDDRYVATIRKVGLEKPGRVTIMVFFSTTIRAWRPSESQSWPYQRDANQFRRRISDAATTSWSRPP